MKNILKINSSAIRLLVCTAVLIIPAAGCKKFLDVPLPTNQIAAQGVFDNDASVAAVATGIYFDMVQTGYVAGGSGIGFCSGLYTDELTTIQTNPLGYTIPFYTDNITDANTAGTWSSIYRQISSCNIAIEGINGSKALIVHKNQYLGEVYVARAWLYFTLVNLYGGVPLALTSDYKTNNALARSTPAQVYTQIIADAKWRPHYCRLIFAMVPVQLQPAAQGPINIWPKRYWHGLIYMIRIGPTRKPRQRIS